MNKGEKKRSPGSDLDLVRSVLKLLAHDLRRSMIVNIATKPIEVSNIVKQLDCSRSTARRNLKKLVDADLLKVDKSKGKRLYHLSDSLSVQKLRGKVILKAEIPGGGSVEMKLNWPPA